MAYHAFLSYSHRADASLAASVQSALQKLARGWYQLRALNVFRDKTSLAANPALWPSIQDALGKSEHFLLMANAASAQSPWVQREVEWWLEHRSPDTLLLILSDGTLAWDDAAGDFDWSRTDAVPRALSRRFRAEPLFVDLRWARAEQNLTLSSPRFRDAILDLAAPLHRIAKEELDGEDVRRLKRTKLVSKLVVAAFGALALAAGAAGFSAWQEGRRAEDAGNLARARQLLAEAEAAGGDLELPILLALESLRQTPLPGAESLLRRVLALQPTRRIMFNLPAAGSPSSFQPAFSPSGGHVAVLSTGRGTRIIPLDSSAAAIDVEREGVRTIAFSRDARVFATLDSEAVLVSSAAGSPPIRLKIAHNDVSSIAMSADGRYLAVGYATNYLQTRSNGHSVFELPEGRELARVEDPARRRVLLSADGRLLATLDASGLRVWLEQDGFKRSSVERPGVVEAAFSGPSSQVLIIVDQARSLRQIQAADGQDIPGREVTGVTSFASSQDSDRLAILRGAEVEVLNGAGGSVTRFAISPGAVDMRLLDSGRLVVVRWRSGSSLFDAIKGNELARVRGKIHAWSADGRSVAAIEGEPESGQWLAVSRVDATGEPLSAGHDRAVCDLAFAASGQLLASAAEDATARVWRLSDGAEVARQQHRGTVAAVQISADGGEVLSAGGGQVLLWDAATRVVRSTVPFATAGRYFQLEGTCRTSPADLSLALGAGAATVAAIANRPMGLVIVTDVLSGREAARVEHRRLPDPLSEDDHLRVALSANGVFLATVNAGTAGRLWDVRTSREVASFPTPSDIVSALAVGDDGSLAWFRGVNQIELGVRGAPGSASQQLHGSASFAAGAAVALSPDHRHIAIANGQSVSVHDREAGRDVTSIQHGAPVNAVAFSPDGRRLATGDAKGAIRIWRWTLDDLMEQACSHVSRNLTPTERERYFPADSTRATCALPAPR